MNPSLVSWRLAWIGLVVGVPSVASGQQLQTEDRAIFSDLPGKGNKHALQVAVDGDRILSGEPNGDNPVGNGGGVLVSERAMVRWHRVARIVHDDAERLDNMGWSVSLDRGTAVVGSPYEGDYALLAGEVYVFERLGSDWVQNTRLGFPELQFNDRFGSSVRIWKDTIAVSATGDDEAGNQEGAVYVFERTGGIWTKISKLLPSPEHIGLALGRGLDLHEDVIVAGSDPIVYVYRRQPTGWAIEDRIPMPGPQDQSRAFGNAVCVWGDWLAIGDPLEDYPIPLVAGRVFLYRRNVLGQWDLTQVLQAKDPYFQGDVNGMDNGKFGFAVDMHEDKLLVGEWRFGTSGPNGEPAHGRAHLYELSPSGEWTETREFRASDPHQAQLGFSVALGDQTAVLGAPVAETDDGTAAGAIYVYDIGLGTRGRPARNNSTGGPGWLAVTGSPWAENHRLSLRAERLPANRVGYFLASRSPEYVPFAGGSSGDLWLAPPIARFATEVAVSDDAGTFSIDVRSIPLDPPVPILAGETWYFQAWFEDDDLGPTSNFTDAVAVTFR